MCVSEMSQNVTEEKRRTYEELYSQYYKYCRQIAYNILGSFEDAEECANDAFIKLWNNDFDNISNIKMYLAVTARNASLDRLREKTAGKRNSPQGYVLLDELQECIGKNYVDEEISLKFLEKSINSFLEKQTAVNRNMFIRRYFFGESSEILSEKFGLNKNNINVILHRMRKQLKKHLEKEEMI